MKTISKTLLNENNETFIHRKKLQFLMTEIYKIKKQPRSTHNASVIPVS